MEKDDLKQDKALIKKAFKQHDKQEHQGGVGTKLKLKKGGLDKVKKMAGGGKTNEGMKMVGRNMEKARANGKSY
jgi:hypothetical protein